MNGVIEEALLEAYCLLSEMGDCDVEAAAEVVGRERLDELVAHGLVSEVCAGNEERVVLASPDTILRGTLTGVLDDVVTDHRRYLAGHSRLSRPRSIRCSGGHGGGHGGELAQVSSDAEELGRWEDEVLTNTRHELLVVGDRILPEQFIASPAIFRAIYASGHVDDAKESVSRGRADRAEAQVRVLDRIGMRMWISDGALALVHLSGGVAALRVRSQVILGALREYFDLLWARALPAHGSTSACPLPTVRYSVLRLSAQGKMSDAEMAERLGLTINTLRRHCAVIRQELDTDSRFAAGAEAVRRGWLG